MVTKSKILLALVLVLFLVSFLDQPVRSENLKLTKALVVDVLDVYTIKVKVDGKGEIVRLIGLEPSENVLKDRSYQKEAINFLKTLLKNKGVYLELDKQERDKNGRLLAYIWLSRPVWKNLKEKDKEMRSKMLNSILLLKGFAKVPKASSNKYIDHFKTYHKEASEKQTQSVIIKKEVEENKDKGIIVYITDTGKKYHREGCRYLEQSKIEISLEEAKRRGYEPCKVCDPPK